MVKVGSLILKEKYYKKINYIIFIIFESLDSSDKSFRDDIVWEDSSRILFNKYISFGFDSILLI